MGNATAHKDGWLTNEDVISSLILWGMKDNRGSIYGGSVAVVERGLESNVDGGHCLSASSIRMSLMRKDEDEAYPAAHHHGELSVQYC